jgi:hypothetical protein
VSQAFIVVVVVVTVMFTKVQFDFTIVPLMHSMIRHGGVALKTATLDSSMVSFSINIVPSLKKRSPPRMKTLSLPRGML